MQPAAIVYETVNSTLTSYATPGALIVAGRTNYNDPAFVSAAEAGAHVLIYIDAIIKNDFGRYAGLLHDSSAYGAATDPWPGGVTTDGTTPLCDFRVGSTLLAKLEAVLEVVVAENPHMAGFFADDVGSRSYFPGFNWDGWSSTDKTAYRNGAIAVAQAFRNVCDRHNLFVIVNGAWNGGVVTTIGGGYPTAATVGCSLADGGCLEHFDGDDPAYRTAYASGPQWAAATPRAGHPIMFAISATTADKTDWASQGTVAYDAIQTDYSAAVAPWGAFHATGLPTSPS